MVSLVFPCPFMVVFRVLACWFINTRRGLCLCPGFVSFFRVDGFVGGRLAACVAFFRPVWWHADVSSFGFLRLQFVCLLVCLGSVVMSYQVVGYT